MLRTGGLIKPSLCQLGVLQLRRDIGVRKGISKTARAQATMTDSLAAHVKNRDLLQTSPFIGGSWTTQPTGTYEVRQSMLYQHC